MTVRHGALTQNLLRERAVATAPAVDSPVFAAPLGTSRDASNAPPTCATPASPLARLR
jgi:hypothetical protein